MDVAHRFGVSVASISRYFITWICFLYFHLKEIDWMPFVDQVKATLPHAFRYKYPTTYIVIHSSGVCSLTPHWSFQRQTWDTVTWHVVFSLYWALLWHHTLRQQFTSSNDLQHAVFYLVKLPAPQHRKITHLDVLLVVLCALYHHFMLVQLVM